MRRSGFTLVELMVSTALIIFTMSILSQAFITGTKSLQDLKAVGDLDERLRAAASIIRRDLRGHWVVDPTDANNHSIANVVLPLNTEKDGEGYFRIQQGSALGSASYVDEGPDADGIHSYRATDHMMSFTVNLEEFGARVAPGKNHRREYYLSGLVPNSGGFIPDQFSAPPYTPLAYQNANDVFLTQFAEVAYFLRPNGQTAGGTPLYTLYRRQMLVVPMKDPASVTNNGIDVAALPVDLTEVSAKDIGGGVYFPTMTQLPFPQWRFAMSTDPNAGNGNGMPLLGEGSWYPRIGDSAIYGGTLDPVSRHGSDILAQDVISFQIRIFAPNAPDANAATQFIDIPIVQNCKDGQYLDHYIYDTWANGKEKTVIGCDYTPGAAAETEIPHNFNIKALQITLRIWDLKAKKARQVTIVQDM